jgi:predicted RNA binding protein YcfA (HicA-like mRNA interferase family)
MERLMKYREYIRLIRADGWRLEKQEGSHQKWVHSTKPGKVTVAGHPNDDIPPGTLKAMLKQTGLR